MSLALSVDIGAVVIGCAGVALAVLADRRAKKASQDAEVANRIAADAVAQAREANRIAEEANQLSQDANTVMEAQSARESERWFVDWTVQWHQETAVLVLVNKGSHPALDVEVVIQGQDFHHLAAGHADVAAGGQIDIPLPKVADERVERSAERRRRVQRMSDAGILWAEGAWSLPVNVVITWSTGLGRPDSQTIEHTLG